MFILCTNRVGYDWKITICFFFQNIVYKRIVKINKQIFFFNDFELKQILCCSFCCSGIIICIAVRKQNKQFDSKQIRENLLYSVFIIPYFDENNGPSSVPYPPLWFIFRTPEWALFIQYLFSFAFLLFFTLPPPSIIKCSSSTAYRKRLVLLSIKLSLGIGVS